MLTLIFYSQYEYRLLSFTSCSARKDITDLTKLKLMEGTTEEDNEEEEDEEQGESCRKMTKPHSKKRKTEGRAPRAVDNAVDATAQNH